MLYFCSVRYFNVHTHTIPLAASEVAIVNEKPQVQGRAEGLFSCGLHPWFLEESQTEEQWKTFQLAAEDKTCCAIGECGLDKVCTTNWSVQVYWFERQIIFANEVKKPLLIHCVRSFEEVIASLEKCNNQVPVVFHGFSKGEQLAAQLVAKGYYLSFGHHLKNLKTADAFRNLSIERVFLENDSADVSIAEVYNLAAQLKECTLETLNHQLWANARSVFGSNLEVWKI
jgi:TatD DNase family protein